jgi:ankyrin repeat protein
MIDHFLERGVDPSLPPDSLTKSPIDTDEEIANYRKAPFIIQAACHGRLKIFKMLIGRGCKVEEEGHIGFSARRKNAVSSNVLGAACFHKHFALVEHLTQNHYRDRIDLNHRSKEKQDGKSKAVFLKEFHGYTPLHLACTGGNENY